MGVASSVSNVPDENLSEPTTNMGEEPLPQDVAMTGEEGMPQDGGMSMSGDMNMNIGNENPEDGGNREKEEIQKNIGKGCSDFRNYNGEDKDELRKWVEGMLNSVVDDSDAGIEGDSEMPEENPQPMPQMETVIFTKKQLQKINEVFGGEDNNKEEKNSGKLEKKVEKKKNNSPFSNPKLNTK